MTSSETFERRAFRIGIWLVAAGTVVAGLMFGPKYGVSFLLGGLLSAVNLKLLIRTINAALARSDRISSIRITAGLHLAPSVDSPMPLCYHALLFFGDYCCNCRICGLQQRDFNRRYFRSGQKRRKVICTRRLL